MYDIFLAAYAFVHHVPLFINTPQTNVFAEGINGIHCVLTNYYEQGYEEFHEGHTHPEEASFTFTIQDGRVESV